jgi:hypothetical protein
MELRGLGEFGGLSARLGVLLDDFEREAVAVLHADGGEDGADGARGSPQLADDFADIFGGDAEAEDGASFFLDSVDKDLIGSVDERFRDLRDEGPHFFCMIANV